MNIFAPKKIFGTNYDNALLNFHRADEVPEDVFDFDAENIGQSYQEPEYAKDIFDYLKARERYYRIDFYMKHQKEINPLSRENMIDWMVNAQQCFNLNHETMYCGVKYVDFYLTRKRIQSSKFLLLTACCLWIAAKYEVRKLQFFVHFYLDLLKRIFLIFFSLFCVQETLPPSVDDFAFVAYSNYTRDEFYAMEIKVLRVLKFRFGFPLSYSFLRRYAQCDHLGMDELTLARYILELSLMNYDLITERDSKMAAACIYMARRMYYNKIGWNATLTYYSGKYFN